MAKLFAHIRVAIGVLALLIVATVVMPAAAQQPSSVNPTASSVKEEELLRQLGTIQGRGTLPDVRSQTIEQPAGRDWRHFHQVTLPRIGAIAIVGMLALLVLFYLIRGSVRLASGRSGQTILRFNAFERFVHWLTASCFIVLALSGLNLTFGKFLLLPYVSPETFTVISQWGKYAHNYLSFPFTIGVILICLMWFAGNLPRSVDVQWLKQGGGIVGSKHPPAYRFNAGQKMIYWIVVLGGAAVAITGYLLMFPFWQGQIAGITVNPGIAGMQLAQVVHGVVGLLYVAAMLAHIYIGTIGMEGAFEAMGTGQVDVNWAKEHHSLWVERMAAKGRLKEGPAAPSATPAE
jgi:formate dehydrogenase subunit gamma